MKNNKWFFTISSIVFTVIAIAHVARIVFDLDVSISGFVIPLWMSGVAAIVSGYLAARGFIAAHKL